LEVAGVVVVAQRLPGLLAVVGVVATSLPELSPGLREPQPSPSAAVAMVGLPE
jgi:hypothetical protein